METEVLTEENILINAKAGDSEAEGKIILLYDRLVRWVIIQKGYYKLFMRNPPAFLDKEDMLSAGRLGVVKAVREFDPSKGIPFHTFAYYKIRGELTQVTNMFYQKNSLFLTYAKSLDASFFDEESFLLKKTNDTHHSDNGDSHELAEVIVSEMKRLLDKRQIDILKLRMREIALEDIGRIYNVKKQRVQQLEARALEKLGASAMLKDFYFEK